MLCFQQLTQLNLVIAVENILTQANSFNLSDPMVVLYGRAGSTVIGQLDLKSIAQTLVVVMCLHHPNIVQINQYSITV